MAATFIKTGECRRVRERGSGESADILNGELCGAKNVLGKRRRLSAGESLEAVSGANQHQLIYLMDGQGVITLETKEYDVARGAGIYLGPLEQATIRHRGSAPLELLHLTVPRISD